MNNFTAHKKTPTTTIDRAVRWRMPRSASCPGPGHYRVDRDLPENDYHEFGTHALTGTKVPPKYTIPTDSRISPDGVVKGLAQSPKANRLGPGHYEPDKLCIHSRQKQSAAYSIPKTLETAEALRERKKIANNPGAGHYAVARYGDDLGQEKTRLMDRAVRRGTSCWAAPQYSHIFACMKPRREPLCPHPAQTASRPLPDASQASAPTA